MIRIRTCSHYGLTQYWLNKLILFSETANVDEYSISSIGTAAIKTTLTTDGLKIYDLGSIFITWSIGLSYSFIILLGEIVMKFIVKSKKQYQSTNNKKMKLTTIINICD